MFLSAFHVSGVRTVFAEGLSKNILWSLERILVWEFSQVVSGAVTIASGRPLRNEGERASADLCVIGSGCEGNDHRCFHTGLVQVESICLFSPSSMIVRVFSYWEPFEVLPGS